MKHRRSITCLFTIIVAICLLIGASPVVPVIAVPPETISSFIDELVIEKDNVYGFEILRPASWLSVDMGDRRGYVPANLADSPNRIMLAVTNLYAVSETFLGENTFLANYELFREDPSLESWMLKTESLWTSNGVQFEKVDELPDTMIYAVRPAPDQIHVIAYVIRNAQPLGVVLYGYGIYNDLDLLHKTGLLVDFKTIVASASAYQNNSFIPEPESEVSVLPVSPESGPFNSDSGYLTYGVFTYRLQTTYYQAPPKVYWLYEYMHYGGDPFHDTWLYRTNVTDDPQCACVYGDSCSLYQHSIEKMASRETHIATDAYTANAVVDHLGLNTAHMMVFGDPLMAICNNDYYPFTQQ